MRRFRPFLFLLSVVLFTPFLAHAQGGCVDSPENPTALLGLVGAGGLLIARSRSRIAMFMSKKPNRHQ